MSTSGPNDSSPPGGAALRAFLAALEAPGGRALLEALDEGLLVFGRDGAILAGNAAAVRILRLEESQLRKRVLFDPAWNAIHEDGSPFDPQDYPASVTLRTGVPSRDAVLGVRHAGDEVTWLRIHAQPLGASGQPPEAVVVGFSDVTLQKRMEPRLLETGRRDAIGRLASGVAHDFNNVLTAITGYTEMLLASADPGDPSVPDLEQIRLASERGALLTRQLLAISRAPSAEIGPLDLDAELARLERQLVRVAGDRVTLKLVPGARGARIPCDPQRLQQIGTSLALNARDAMPEGGTLAFETAVTTAGPGAPRDAARAAPPSREGSSRVDAPPGSSREPGRWVTLVVRDDGPGMDEPTRQRAFEPFFTTRAPGRASGLGLTMVRGLVLECGGAVELRSAPGQGTAVTLWWPACAPELSRQARPATAVAAGTILLVEDEDPVRAVLAGLLRANGFGVIEAPDGNAALRAARAVDGPIDILVSDVQMPGMKGTELARRLRVERPGLRVVFVSGYPDVEGTASVPAGDQRVLVKPFSGAMLLARVREVMASPSPP